MNKAIEARQPAANAAPDQQPRGRPFAKGVSGNPAGKSPGTKNRATRILEALLEGEAEAVRVRQESTARSERLLGAIV